MTTTQAGMAVPDWPSTYGYNMFLYPWTTWLLGPWDLFIEHGHRLLGALVGMITIAVAFYIWRADSRRWLKTLGFLAVAAVIAQGVLGGMRVLLDERTLAKIHGCTGPAFFAFAVALAVFTSRWWRELAPAESLSEKSSNAVGSLSRLSLITTLLAYVQLVLGAELRHVAVGATPRYFQTAVYFHLFMAVVLTVHVLALATMVWIRKSRVKAFTRPALALIALILCQLLIGAGTWVAKYAWPGFLAAQSWTADYTISAGGMLQSLIVTGHVATGSLILVTALMLTLRLARVQWLQSSVSESSVDKTTSSPQSNVSHFTGQFWSAEVAT